jgi:hypothetical protein
LEELSNKGDWPSLIIEAGMSESLPRLRSDAIIGGGWSIQPETCLAMYMDPASHQNSQN